MTRHLRSVTRNRVDVAKAGESDINIAVLLAFIIDVLQAVEGLFGRKSGGSS